MRYSHFKYIPHALEAMQKRKISAKQVENTVNHPHKFYISRGRKVAERVKAHGNTLRVVYTDETGEARVITATIITVMRIAPRG